MWRPEPGRCGCLLHPRLRLVPPQLAELVDGHLRPLGTGSIAPAVRIACEHIDWELVWLTDPDLFWRGHTSVSTAPAPENLWEAGAAATQAGYRLVLDVHVQPIPAPPDAPGRGPQPAVVVHGVGIEGQLPDALWREMTRSLTTCGSSLYEPRHDYLQYIDNQSGEPGPPRVPRSPIPGTRPIANAVRPENRLVGDWPHTWWSFPQFGTTRKGCDCPAHPAMQPPTSDFGPLMGSS